MKKILKFLFFFLLLVCLILLNFAVSYIFVFPFSKINIVLSILLLYMFWRETGVVVWISFFLHFFNEFYAVTQFGILLISGTVSILFSFWMFKSIFSNKSVYSIFVLSFLTMILYRVIYIFLIGIINIIGIQSYVFEWQKLLSFFFWEILLTSLLTTFLYFVLIKIKKPANFIRESL